MMPLHALALAACLAVGAGSDQILAGDLAGVIAEWSGVPPSTPLALAPAPGVQRILRLPELRRMAARLNLSAIPDREVCVTRPAALYDATQLLSAMRRELPAARIELLDYSRLPAPEGDLVFPLSGLRQSAGSGPAANSGSYWNGFVAYGGKHRFTLWARVKVQSSVERVVATQDIKPGIPLEAAQFHLETRLEMPGSGFADVLSEIAGKMSRRPIASGTAIRTEWLEPSKAVQRGETVQVEVIQGSARLKLEGVAQASGAVGDTIAVQNPVSLQRFPARIEAKGRVVVSRGSL